VTDLKVHQNDLVVATQGRSFWILDDVTPLHQITERVAESSAHLFRPRDTYRAGWQQLDTDETYVRDQMGAARLKRQEAGMNPPAGAMIFYYLAEPVEEITVEVLDGRNRPIRSFTAAEGSAPNRAGMNRLVWDLSYSGEDAPRAVPGSYQVRLSAGDWSGTESFQVLKDPRISTTVAEFQQQFDLLIEIQEKNAEVSQALEDIQEVRERVNALASQLGESTNGREIQRQAVALDGKLTDIEGQLIRVRHRPSDPRDAGSLALQRQLGFLTTMVSSADTRPTDQAEERLEELAGALVGPLNALRTVFSTDVANFNRSVLAEGVQPVPIP
jgi:hypothetical protein